MGLLDLGSGGLVGQQLERHFLVSADLVRPQLVCSELVSADLVR